MSINKYNAFKNFVEGVEASNERHLFVLADHYHKGIRGGLKQAKSEEVDDVELLQSTVEWYQRHALDIGLGNLKFSVLTANEDLLKQANSRPQLPLTSLLELLYKTNSNLLDFMGFEVDQSVFPPAGYE